MKRKILTGLCLLSVSVAGCSLEGVADLAEEAAEPRPEVTLATEPMGRVPDSDLADMVERVLPTVVNVRVRSVSFDEFGDAQEGRGQGSGVVIDPSGIIVTNNHVVAGASEVEVVFNDGERLDGQVIGTDPDHDVAVIQIDTDEAVEAIQIGDSSSLRLGDDVVAIGFPLGLGGPTVTKGIVSAEDRDIDVQQADASLSGTLEGLLQTDAAINPGNSGGALVDTAGRLIGINTAAALASSAENIGFAIPIDTALPIAQEIIEDPPEERAYLGVQIRDLSPAVAGQLDIDPDLEGALVMGLFPDGPAETAGIEQGDVIIEIGGIDIDGVDDVTTALRESDPGDVVEVVIVRDGEEEVFEVEVEARPTTFG